MFQEVNVSNVFELAEMLDKSFDLSQSSVADSELLHLDMLSLTS